MDELYKLQLVPQDLAMKQETDIESGMEERKLAALDHYFKAAIGKSDVVMWFVMPGGFIKGKPIGVEEYHVRMKRSKTEIEPMDLRSRDRFFYLDEAVIVLGEGTKKLELGLIVLDGLKISAWGYAQRKKRMVFKNL